MTQKELKIWKMCRPGIVKAINDWGFKGKPKSQGLEVRIKPKRIFYTGSDLTQEELQKMSVGMGIPIIYQQDLEKEIYGENNP
jgi:hypothetical protein